MEVLTVQDLRVLHRSRMKSISFILDVKPEAENLSELNSRMLLAMGRVQSSLDVITLQSADLSCLALKADCPHCFLLLKPR